MQRELTSQQTEAVGKLKRLRVGALFMACGTGKTQTAVALVNSIDDSDLLVWLCPCRVIDNLKTELERCGLNRHAEIVGIESMVSDRTFLHTKEILERANKPILICDESLKIKNITAKRTKRILELSNHAWYKLILNGTPVTKNILDVYTQMEFLSPKIFKCSLQQFKRRYCVVVEKRIGNTKVGEWVKRAENVDHLLSVIDPYVFSCELKLSVEKEHREICYDLDEESQKDYAQLKAEMLEQMKELDDTQTGTLVLGYFQRMQQAYCCAAEKFRIVERIADEKTIVFCKFVRSAETLRARFPKLTVLTYGKNSIGLNLQHMNKCIYFDKTFDYAFAEQSEYRIFRTGQKEPCRYYHLTARAGLEKIFDACISRKVSLVQYFKENGNKVLEGL